METQYLQYFVSVAQHLSFSRAAAASHVSQPALSAQIKKFEESLGCQLFFRSKRHVQLTPEGAELLPRARRVLSEMSAIKEMAVHLSHPLDGKVRVGFSSVISMCRAFPALRKVQASFPKMQMSLEEDHTQILIDRLRNAELDLILVQDTPALSPEVFEKRAFDRTPMVIIEPNTPDPFRKHYYVTPRTGCPMQAKMEEFAMQTGRPLEPRFWANDLHVVKRVVELGAGWAILPKNALRSDEERRLAIIPVENAFVEFVIATNRGLRAQMLLDAFEPLVCAGKVHLSRARDAFTSQRV